MTTADMTYQRAWPIYRPLGWPAIPLPRGAKLPPPPGFTGREGVDPSGADCAEFENVRLYRGTRQTAIRMPVTVIGLDVDAYTGRTGGATITEGVQRWGQLPGGPWSSARDDGVSGIRFFRVPPAAVFVSDVAFPDLGVGHVEVIRRTHRYAVVWPSVHPRLRQPYTWRNTPGSGIPPAVDDLPELPDRWIDGLRPRKRTVTHGSVPVGQPASKALLAGVLRFVLDAKPGNRNDRLWWGSVRLFERVRDRQLDEAAATNMLDAAASTLAMENREAAATIASARKAVLGG